MTIDELIPLSKEWQSVLRLDDWWIEFQLIPYFEWEDKDSYGDIQRFDEQKRARIRILNQATAPEDKDSLTPMNEEEVIVHELCHLWTDRVIEPWLSNGQAYMPPHEYQSTRANSKLGAEQLLNALARAMVALKYGPEYKWGMPTPWRHFAKRPEPEVSHE